MSAYELDDERAIRTGRQVDDWTQSGLLTQEQRDLVMPQLAVSLRRTNKFLRVTLFIFGAVILQSVLGLLAVILNDIANSVTAAALCLMIGGGCFWLASRLVTRYSLYRFGVEEAVALSAAALVAGGAALLVGDEGNWALVIGLAVGAGMLASLFVYFGYVYAAVMAMVAVAALPFQFGDSEIVQRMAAVIVLATIAIVVRNARSGYGDEHPGDALTVIEATAWLGIYLLVNLAVSSVFSTMDRASVFHWVTYAGIWVLPAIGLWLALRGRERPLLLVSLAMALGTLLSNKAYLGSPRYEWDPILFGALLMGIATVVRRWLASGEGGMRHGYTPVRLVASDQSLLAGLATVSSVHTNVPVASSAPAVDPAIGGGGRSGGAGAGGSF
jgi:hypothetical protein